MIKQLRFSWEIEGQHIHCANCRGIGMLSPYHPMAKCLIVELQVQDRPVHLMVDTGLQGMLLCEGRLRKSVPRLRTAGSIKNATIGGRVQVKQATLPDVRFGNRNREVQVTFLPSPATATLSGIDGIVGIDALQARRVHFDFSRKTLTWE
jgi:hypothetical protein